MKLREILLGAFIAVSATTGTALADSKPANEAVANVAIPEYQSVTVHGHTLDLQSVSIDDPGNFLPWDEVERLVPKVLPNSEEELSLEEMCTRIFMTHDDVRNVAERLRYDVIAGYAKIYHSAGEIDTKKYDADPLLFDQEIIDKLNDPTGEGVQSLIEDHPLAEAKVLQASEYAKMWSLVELLNDATIDECPEFADQINRRKILSSEAPASQDNAMPEDAVAPPSPE